MSSKNVRLDRVQNVILLSYFCHTFVILLSYFCILEFQWQPCSNSSAGQWVVSALTQSNYPKVSAELSNNLAKILFFIVLTFTHNSSAGHWCVSANSHKSSYKLPNSFSWIIKEFRQNLCWLSPMTFYWTYLISLVL